MAHADNRANTKTVADYFKDKPVRKVYLFGSYVRGEADEGSNVDLLLELDSTQLVGLQFFGWSAALKEVWSRKVDVVSAAGLRNDRLFTRFVLKERVLLYAKPAKRH